MSKVIFLLGGAGNVFFQLLHMSKKDCEFEVSPFFISKTVRKLLGHTEHRLIHSQIFSYGRGVSARYLKTLFALVILLLDLCLARVFKKSLFTTFDLRQIKLQPSLFDFISIGYFQAGVKATDIRSSDLLKIGGEALCDLCVHVRGGDFVRYNTTLTGKYYDDALNSIDFNGFTKNMVVTNDVNYAMELVGKIAPLLQLDYTSNDEVSDFLLLNSSSVVVCSNSTFAFVAALTSTHIRKLILPSELAEKFDINFVSEIEVLIF